MTPARVLSLLDWLAGRPYVTDTDPPRQLATYMSTVPSRGAPLTVALSYWPARTVRPYEITDPESAWRATFATEHEASAWLTLHKYNQVTRPGTLEDLLNGPD